MKFSIIMPSFNQAQFVETAIQSVLEQDYANKEILFIDGGSRDGTMEVVNKYREHLNVCISEPDSGQSHALQKGFSLATGDILTWLNTDDLLLPGALTHAANAFIKNPQRTWLLGNVIWIDENNKILKCWRGDGYTPGFLKLGILAAGGPSAFFTKTLYESVGGINRDLKYQMDTELWWRFAMTGSPFHRLQNYTWALRLHKDAKVSGHMFAPIDDEKQRLVANEKRLEFEHIQRLTKNFRISTFPGILVLLSIIRKSLSPSYAWGCIENMIYRGRPLSSMQISG